MVDVVPISNSIQTYNRTNGRYLIDYVMLMNDQYLTYERRVETASATFSKLGGISGLVQ